MTKERTYISFDWALKRLLRDKANFDVLEGFLSTLLNTTIKIHCYSSKFKENLNTPISSVSCSERQN